MEKEVWKSIPESRKYMVSNYGKCKNLKTGRLLSLQIGNRKKKSSTYQYVIKDSCINNKKHLIRRSVSMMVMRAFSKDYVKGKPAYRIDGNPYNNYIDNFTYHNFNQEKAQQERVTLIKSLKKEWQIEGDLSDSRNRVHVKHLVCGNKFDCTLAQIVKIGKPVCACCFQKALDRKHMLIKKKAIYKKYVGRYYLMGITLDRYAPLMVYDKKYGNYFTYSSYADIANSCVLVKSPLDKPKQSIPESMIEFIIQELGLSYYWQYFINDCRDVLPLPFDFAIMEEDKYKPLFLIEYQGEQHRKGRGFLKNARDRSTYLRHDIIKKNYCDKNGITLIYLYGNNYQRMYKMIEKEISLKNHPIHVA